MIREKATRESLKTLLRQFEIDRAGDLVGSSGPGQVAGTSKVTDCALRNRIGLIATQNSFTSF